MAKSTINKKPEKQRAVFGDDAHRMESGRAPLDRFIPYPSNPRTHPPAEIELLAEILKMRGADQPIVVDEAWMILKGHGRLASALKAGLDGFPYVRRFGLSDQEKTAMRIEDNQVALLAGWDRALISGEIASLKLAGYDVALLGFGETQLVQFTTTPGPPAQFPEFSESIATDYCCPKCGYKWSGKPTPESDGDKVPKAKKTAKKG